MTLPRASIALIFFMLASACTNAGQINGHSLKTAHKSVNFIKEHLPAEQRLEFEIAYWALRQQLKTDNDFLKAIDGKSAQELIAQAKAGFADRKATGAQEYAAYDSWEQMLNLQLELRKTQNGNAVDSRDKKGYPRVDYKMHAM